MNIEDIQHICNGLPQVTEDIKWKNDLVFLIGGKIFCIIDINKYPITVSFKVTTDEFEELCSREGFAPAPYVAKYHWVLINDFAKISSGDLKKLIKQSYTLVKNKLPDKTKKLFGIQ